MSREPPFDAAFAPFIYAHPFDLLMTRFKFGRNLAAGRVLSELWIESIDRASIPRSASIVPVPLHASRLRARGFNQALELAKPLAVALCVPLCADLLRRDRATAAQIELPADVRRRNLKGAFSVSNAEKLPLHVVLLDDVMTTGATVHECARVLKRAGVERVDVWALARAPAPRR